MRTLRFATAIGVMVAALVASIAPASAGNASTGVKYVHFDAWSSSCLEGQAQPCSPDTGNGYSNVLRVQQSGSVHAGYSFDTLEGTGHTADHLWMAVMFGGKCTVAYRLHQAYIGLGTIDFPWSSPDGDVQEPVGWSQSVPVNHGNRTMPDAVRDVHIPLGQLFQDDYWGGYPLFGFESAEDIYAHGEAVVASRMAEGMSEGEARSQPFELTTHLAMHGALACDWHWEAIDSTSGYSSSELVPVTVEFHPISEAEAFQLDAEPIEPLDVPLGTETSVDQAFLSVQPDESHPCKLRLAGVIATNGETEVEYRFVTELGLTSQVFSTTVDQTHVSMIDHYVWIPEADDLAPQDQLTANQGDRGAIDELAAAPSDKVSGTYHIEVLAPHHFVGNVAGYNVDPCVTVTGQQAGRGPADVYSVALPNQSIQTAELPQQVIQTEVPPTRGN